MNPNSKLLDMLTGYAAAHRHPVNVAVHMVGIPCIMFGALVALSWPTIGIDEFSTSPAWLLVFGFFAFYATLDLIFALVFLAVAVPMAWAASLVGELPLAVSGSVAAATFVGGYLAQFAGHAIEKSQPVLLRHPIQAQLAAPFFTVVEAFNLLGLRDDLFREVEARLAAARAASNPGPDAANPR